MLLKSNPDKTFLIGTFSQSEQRYKRKKKHLVPIKNLTVVFLSFCSLHIVYEEDYLALVMDDFVSIESKLQIKVTL